VVRAWVDEIPDDELDQHYAKAVDDLDDDDLSMLAAWHASLEVGHPIANKEFLLGAFSRLGEHRREALRIAAGFRGEDAFDSGVSEEVSSSWLFVFIGASPRTEWLGPEVVRDERGFVVTGQDLLGPMHANRWPLSRAPFALETSVPGVFAAGDVRLDSMKRVASAVGEGAMSIYLVHRYLATI
jgi:hypothetical protein